MTTHILLQRNIQFRTMFLIVSLAQMLSGFSAQVVHAQACSCASAPLMSSLETGAISEHNWHFSLTYEHNAIDTLVSGTKELDDLTAERTTQTYLMDVSYGISEAWSVTGILTFVEHIRDNRGAGFDASDETLTTRGIGDGVLLLKYNLLGARTFSPRELTVGIGVKIPLGSDDLTANDLTVAEDMQPGTGAWDGIVWGNLTHNFFVLPDSNVYLTGTYRFTGANQRGYRFGNELVTNFGFNYFAWDFIDATLGFRFRRTDPDQRSGAEIPNSGGNWLNFVPALNIKITEGLSFRLSGQIPLYRDLEGTQLTNSFTALGAVYYQFSNDKN